MRTKIKSRLLYLTTPFLFMTLLLSACEVFMPTPPPAPPVSLPASADPFNTRIEGEDGKVIELAGPSANLLPGSQAGYQLSIFNNSEELWEGSYCLILVDTDGFVTLLAEDHFSLSPRDGFGIHLPVTFPEDIPPARYGLSFIIPERWATVTTIDLGGTQRESAGPWPAVECP
jgi:hypothetical protein